jgi:hypothetical protein
MHPTFFLKHDVYLKLGGYLDNPWAEDYDFLLRAFLNEFQFAKLPELLLDKGDHPSRLARTDDRCKRSAMFRAKAFYFVRKPSLWQMKKRFLVVGTGSAGKMVYQALTQAGFKIDGFVDHGQRSAGATFLGKPLLLVSSENRSIFFKKQRDSLFLVAIDVEESRQDVETVLQDQGLVAGLDYFRFI